MPLLKLQVSAPVPESQRDELLAALSKAVASSVGKPEKYVMVTLAEGAAVMAGQAGPAAFADVRSIGGLNGRVNNDLTKKVCALLHQFLGIPADRVYLTFTDVPAANWGWNSETFG